MTYLTSDKTYTVEQCQQMIAKYRQDINDNNSLLGTSWYDGRDVARQALMTWQHHLKDAYAHQELRRTKYDNGISGHYHD